MTTTDALARMHDAVAEDADLAALGHEFIGLFLEYQERHGYTPETARAAAIRDVIAGIRATPDLRADGYLTNAQPHRGTPRRPGGRPRTRQN